MLTNPNYFSSSQINHLGTKNMENVPRKLSRIIWFLVNCVLWTDTFPMREIQSCCHHCTIVPLHHSISTMLPWSLVTSSMYQTSLSDSDCWWLRSPSPEPLTPTLRQFLILAGTNSRAPGWRILWRKYPGGFVRIKDKNSSNKWIQLFILYFMKGKKGEKRWIEYMKR